MNWYDSGNNTLYNVGILYSKYFSGLGNKKKKRMLLQVHCTLKGLSHQLAKGIVTEQPFGGMPQAV
jgi:hypothetical protein